MIIYTLGILETDSKFLFLLRQNTQFFNGYYGLMGGKIEKNESITDALIREAYEELDISITKDNLKFAHCLSFKNEKDEEILALIFKIVGWNGTPINKEPDKCAELAWFTLNTLPDNIIPRHHQIINMIQNGVLYSENGW